MTRCIPPCWSKWIRVGVDDPRFTGSAADKFHPRFAGSTLYILLCFTSSKFLITVSQIIQLLDVARFWNARLVTRLRQVSWL